jgi:hypothetical protein
MTNLMQMPNGDWIDADAIDLIAIAQTTYCPPPATFEFYIKVTTQNGKTYNINVIAPPVTNAESRMDAYRRAERVRDDFAAKVTTAQDMRRLM